MNKVGEAGMKELLAACQCNTNLLLLDVTQQNNNVYEKKSFKKLFKHELLNNLKITIQNYVERAGNHTVELKHHAKGSTPP